MFALSHYSSWGLADILIAVVIIAACVGLVWIALRQFNVTIPDWVIQVFWTLVVCVVIIFAIRFVTSL